MGRGETVPAAVGNLRRPVQGDPGDGGDTFDRLAGPARLLRLLGRDQGLTPLQYAFGERDRARGAGHQVDAGADLGGEGGQPVAVPRRAHVDQRDDDVPLTRVRRVQRADGVEHGVAGGELVVDQHQSGGLRSARQQLRVLRQQQVRGGVRVGLLEASRLCDARDGPPGGVEVRGVPQAVRDGVAEAGGRLRVPEDDRAAGVVGTEERPYALTEPVPRPVHDGGPLGHMLAQHVGDEQVGPLGVAPQGEAQQLLELPVPLQGHSQPLGHPVARPHHVHGLFSPDAPAHRYALTTLNHRYALTTLGHRHAPPRALTASGRRPAGPRSRRPRSPPRRPRPAGACARPRPGAASLHSSCSYTPSAAPRRPRDRAAGCPARR